MNVTLNLFSGAAAGTGETVAGAATALGTGPEALSSQTLGNANPFALLLSGQLRSGPPSVGSQGLPLALAKAAPPATLQNLPPAGKSLPEATAALQSGEQADGINPSVLLPLPWAASSQAPLPEGGPTPALQLNSDGEGNLTLNIMKLALGRTDDGADSALAATKGGGDDQALLRLMQSGVVRVEAERAAALLQAEAGPTQQRTETGNQTGTPVTAATAVTGEAARGAEAQRPAPVAQAQATLPQPLGRQGWDQDLGSRLVWMSKHNLDSAQLRLNPAHLGPLEVRLSVQQDQTANVAFLSNHAPVREAVEAALPRLREMLAESGVNLTDVNVSSHSQGQGRAQEQNDGAPWLAQGDGESDATMLEDTTRTMAVGLVDYFA